MNESGVKFDLIYIDAAHMYHRVLKDCNAWWPLIKSPGLFCGHDIDNKRSVYKVRKAVEKFCSEKQLEFVVLPGMVWMIKVE